MAALSNAVRQQIWRGIMRYWSREREALGTYTKAELQAAINAADDWVDSNASSFNSALPQPFRTQATTAQKAFLLACVTLARGNAALLRQILGEVE